MRARKPTDRERPFIETSLPRRLLAELLQTARRELEEEAVRSVERALEAKEAGDTKALRRAAVRAKQAAPRSLSVRELLGLASFELEEWHEAQQELLTYRRFSDNRKHDPLIAECYRRLGRAQRALDFLADLKRAHVGDDGWVDAQIVRARGHSDSGRAPAGASLLRSFLRTGLKRAPAERVARALADIESSVAPGSRAE